MTLTGILAGVAVAAVMLGLGVLGLGRWVGGAEDPQNKED